LGDITTTLYSLYYWNGIIILEERNDSKVEMEVEGSLGYKVRLLTVEKIHMREEKLLYL
jgi:hypothetical protein